MIRNTLKYVSYKDQKSYADDLKKIYNAPSEEIAHQNMERIAEKWNKLYPHSMDRWQKTGMSSALFLNTLSPSGK